ncbi:hypothetical protein ED733_006544 [Metarhizium rileyi]|nr:hypothetical protein ED733_006544 [Metarhizium rileyi]
MVSASSVESVSSKSTRRTVYPGGRMKTMDYMYSVWPIPQNRSMMLRFVFYVTGAPVTATHLVGKFPRSRVDETQHGYDLDDMAYTDQGAHIYWATARGSYDLFRHWGVTNAYYTEGEAGGEAEDVAEETAGSARMAGGRSSVQAPAADK